MKGLLLLIPVSLLFFGLAVAFFMWAVNAGQYDDLEGEAERLLFDDESDDEKSNDAAEQKNVTSDAVGKPERSDD